MTSTCDGGSNYCRLLWVRLEKKQFLSKNGIVYDNSITRSPWHVTQSAPSMILVSLTNLFLDRGSRRASLIPPNILRQAAASHHPISTFIFIFTFHLFFSKLYFVSSYYPSPNFSREDIIIFINSGGLALYCTHPEYPHNQLARKPSVTSFWPGSPLFVHCRHHLDQFRVKIR